MDISTKDVVLVRAGDEWEIFPLNPAHGSDGLVAGAGDVLDDDFEVAVIRLVQRLNGARPSGKYWRPWAWKGNR